MDDESQPPAAHLTYYFRRDGDRWEPTPSEAESVAWIASDRSRPLVVADLAVTVFVYLTEVGATPGRVVVQTVADRQWEHEGHNPQVTLSDRNAPIDSTLWRAIPIGGLIARTLDAIPKLYRGMAEGSWIDRGDWGTDTGAEKRGGPATLLTYEVLANVVAPAYQAGGTRAAVAVRQALIAAGYPGSGPDGEVTPDQARKAIAKARKTISRRTGEPLIPPAKRKGSNDE